MAIIKELPTLDRPREKALRYGVNTLSDAELLAILISKGYQGKSALEVSNELLSEFKGLTMLSKVPFGDLMSLKGIKEAKAITLAVIFELHNRLSLKEKENEEIEVSSEYLYNKYKVKLSSSTQENLILIILNSRRNIIREKTLYIGTENNMFFSYKDVWREMFSNQGKYFYLIHNHPGKSSSPSKEDIVFTSELFLESKRLKIPMIDHLIIGDDGYYSFQELGKKYV